MFEGGASYEVRRGWSPVVVVSVCGAAVLGVVLLAAGLSAASVRLGVFGIVCLAGAGINAWSALRNLVAIRVDDQGIVLAPPTLLARVPAAVPWAEVQSIVAFKRKPRSELGVVKRNAGIPATEFTPGGQPLPDVSILVVAWKLDLPALAAAVHAHAPDVEVFDERQLDSRSASAEPAPHDPGLRKRQVAAAGVGAVLLTVFLTALALTSPARQPTGYTVVTGPAGHAPTLILPQQLDSWMLEFSDPAPAWKFYPNLLPNSSTATYNTTTGSYLSTSAHDMSVDAVYASESSDGAHRGVFSLAPQALVTLVNSTMAITDARPISMGGSGSAAGLGVLECGTYVDGPQCVWADDSALVIATYTDVPGTLQSLASSMPEIIRAVTGA